MLQKNAKVSYALRPSPHTRPLNLFKKPTHENHSLRSTNIVTQPEHQ